MVVHNLLGAEKEYTVVPWLWSDQHDLTLQVVGLPSSGSTTVARRSMEDVLVLFHLTEQGRLVGASGICVGNAFARDIKLAEMLIAKARTPVRRILPTLAFTSSPCLRRETAILKGRTSAIRGMSAVGAHSGHRLALDKSELSCAYRRQLTELSAFVKQAL
jgi:hypothetical protein